MQTDKEFFRLIKNAYPLNPRDEFISSTSNKLKQTARNLNRKRRIKQFSIASTSIALFVVALSWIIFFGGKDIITNNLAATQESNLASSVNEQDPLVYIYHSHNFESFLSETQTKKSQEAFHEEKNITLVGERLSQSLKERGINSIHDETNIMQTLKEKDLEYYQSYKISRKPLKRAIENNNSIKMVLDLHRGSQKRSVTTVNINGEDYSRVALVVSSSSTKYEENVQFAKLLHNKMEEKYPGLSRGVIVKNNKPQQNTYNQDLLDNSVLLNIGGVENTFQEEYRTVDVLAGIIEDILMNEN